MSQPKFNPGDLERDIERWMGALLRSQTPRSSAEAPTLPLPLAFFPDGRRNMWLPIAISIVARAASVVARLSPSSIAVLCLPMGWVPSPLGLNFEDADGLMAQIELGAPFIYLAEPHEAPWDLEEHFVVVPRTLLGPPNHESLEAMLDEYPAIPGYRYDRNLHLFARN
ncbi:MAG: hypothetical protein ABIW85_04475 [Variovorax sp.]